MPTYQERDSLAQHGLETRSRRLNLVVTNELMQSPIAAVTIADGRSRDARAYISYGHRCR